MKVINIKKYYILILFIYSTVYGQNSDYRNIYQTKKLIAKDTAKAYCDFLILSNKVNQRAFGYNSKGYLLTLEKEYITADSLFEIASLEIKKINNPLLQQEEKLYLLANKSVRWLLAQETEKALPFIDDGQKLAIKLNNKRMVIRFNMLFGTYYSISGRFKEAYNLGVNTLKVIEDEKSSLLKDDYVEFTSKTLTNLSSRAKNHYLRDTITNKMFLDSASYYGNKNRVLLKQFNVTSPRRILYSNNAIGEIYFYKKEYSSSLSLYKESLKIAQNNKFLKEEFQLKFRISECYFHNNNFIEALKWFQLIDDENLKKYKLNEFYYKKNYYLFKINQSIGNIKQTSYYAEKWNESYIKNKSAREKAWFNATNFSISTKNKEIERYLKENEQLVSKNYKYLFMVLLVLSVFGAFRFNAHRKKSKIQLHDSIKKLEQKKISSFVNITKEKKSLYKNNKGLSDYNTDKIMKRLLKLEENNEFLKYDFTIQVVSKKIETNTTYLSKFVNTHLNMSFVDYVNDLRISYVIERLKIDSNFRNYTIKAIANEVGYKSTEALNRNFKKVTQFYPTEYLGVLKQKANQDS